jgi:hypothetical protein
VLNVACLTRSDEVSWTCSTQPLYGLTLSAVAPPPFQTPTPKPAKGYKVELTDPKLYRPFRHGPNFITMGIRKMDWNEWIEMDSNFIPYHDTKVKELEKDVNARVQYVDNEVTRLACFEVLDELTHYLTHRYPDVFQLRNGVIHNTVTGEHFPYPAATPQDAMVTAAKLVQDDLVLMVENDDGQYHIDAGAVCLPGFWRLSEKFGMSLDELHIEAGVPHYEEKLQKAMNRFFKKMTCDKPVIRNNVSHLIAYVDVVDIDVIISTSFNSTMASHGRTAWVTRIPMPWRHGQQPTPPT